MNKKTIEKSLKKAFLPLLLLLIIVFFIVNTLFATIGAVVISNIGVEKGLFIPIYQYFPIIILVYNFTCFISIILCLNFYKKHILKNE